jgi:hypothetical protein
MYLIAAGSAVSNKICIKWKVNIVGTLFLIFIGIGFLLLLVSYSEENANAAIKSSLNNNYQAQHQSDSRSQNDYAPRQPQKSLTNAFSENKMREIDSKGYEFYQEAVKQKSADLFLKAGNAYDHSYKSFWGDNVFGQVDYYQFLEQLMMSSIMGEEEAEQMIHIAQESLVISCECYAKTLEIEPYNYEANLKLATALTVALQVQFALPYWNRLFQINDTVTAKCLIADSMGFNHRSIAVKEVIYRLGLGGSPQGFSQNYLEKQNLASKMLHSSPYLANNILR